MIRKLFSLWWIYEWRNKGSDFKSGPYNECENNKIMKQWYIKLLMDEFYYWRTCNGWVS